MLKQQDLIDKANDDFVKFKARLLYLGKEKIFQQSEKIEFAKTLKEELEYPFQIMDNDTLHALLDMDNIYDVFYRYYKPRKHLFGTIPEHVKITEIFASIIFDYKDKYMKWLSK